jgi:hypothetical protein
MSDWADWNQNRWIRDLRADLTSVEASLHSARSQHRRLQAELSKVSGSLEQRLSRLSAAFDAFVEISDLRITLNLFDEHARVRHRARQMFGEHPLPGELSDVDGYWLAPALAAAQATVDGLPATDALSLARSRDARRATVFQVLAVVLLGKPEAVDQSLYAEAFTELDTDVAMHQRALWLVAADGLTVGRHVVLRHAAACVEKMSATDTEAAVSAWLRAVKPDKNVAGDIPSELGMAKDLINAMDACERLSVLRQWVAGRKATPSGDIAPLVQSTLVSLVDEGSPLELPLLQRERELRKIIEAKSEATPDGWESSVGTMLELLKRDAVDDDHPGRQALAVQISAPHIIAAAERIADQARRPLETQVQLRTSLGTVTISKLGPDEASLNKALVRAAGMGPMPKPRRQIAYTAAAFGVGLVILGIFAGWGWLVPAAVAFAVTWWQLRLDRSDRAAAAEKEKTDRARVRAEVEAGTQRYRELCTELDRSRGRIDDDLRALRESLSES